MNIKKRIDEIYPEMVEIRRDLHRNPELSEQEYRTSKKVEEYLRSWNIPYRSGYAVTGIVGIIEGKKKGKTVGIRADMDALPLKEVRDIPYKSQNDGVMHACGHDVHTTILLGAARILNEMKEELPGNVKLFFQPAEETIGGAERMIKDGCMEDPKVEYTIGLHVHSGLPCGKISVRYGKTNAATGDVIITVHGKSGHGAHPDVAVDAIIIASHIVIALQTVVSRSVSAVDSIVLTIGKVHGGTKTNIIADTVVLEGTLRSLDEKTRKKVKNLIIQIAKNTAKAYGGSADVDFKESFIALINCDEVIDVIKETAIRLYGKEQVVVDEPPSLGAEDFSYFCEVSKGGFFSIGTGNEAMGITASIHNNQFDVDENCIKIGIEMHVNAALTLLSKSDSMIEEGI